MAVSAMNIRFDGKRALVTGAGRGIGRSIALSLAAFGAETIAADISETDLEQLKKENPGIKTIRCDISDWDGTTKVLNSLGPIDLLVNNAGVAFVENVGAVTEKGCDRTLNINLKAAINISQVIAQKMIENKLAGAIVNMSSQAATLALDGHVTYAASKGGIEAVTRVLALELGPHQIRVNAVAPTVVMTEMGRKAWDNEEKGGPMKAKIPLGRFAEVKDVVHAVLYLLSDQADMITGTSLHVDGGATC